ncbi:MAG: murein biosynthesis integral membrane protein MurJ [Candidatus Babeliales bacterium]
MITRRNTIITKAIEVGSSTLFSRGLGIIREVLLTRYMGVGMLLDAFLSAYKIPNFMRKLFAEGALSASFVPTFVPLYHEKGKEQLEKLITLSFFVIESIVLVLCLVGMVKARAIIAFTVPGFSEAQIEQAAHFLQLLMPFVFFLSTSALLAGALQSVNHFFIPAISPVVLNVCFLGALVLCLYYSLPVTYLCYGILLGGVVELILHIVAYKHVSLRFNTAIDRETWKNLYKIVPRFVFCLVSMSTLQISYFVDTWFASYLPPGTITLVHYANRFMGIPLGVFAAALATILLPYLSRITVYTPQRLPFYFFESAKLVFWITLPATVFMAFFSEQIFLTIFLSKEFTYEQVVQVGAILRAFLVSLFCFSLNKIMLNLYYAKHKTWIPAVISVISAGLNWSFNCLFVSRYQAVGLALATSISVIIQSILFIVVLHYYLEVRFYGKAFCIFALRYLLQCLVMSIPFFGIYFFIASLLLRHTHSSFLVSFFIEGFGLWFWVGPLASLCMYVLYYSRKLFKVRLYFLGS